MYVFIDRLAVRITAVISAVVWPIVFNTKSWLFKPLSYETFCDLPILNVYFCCFTYNMLHIIFSVNLGKPDFLDFWWGNKKEGD